jgi:hypothetical protein
MVPTTLGFWSMTDSLNIMTIRPDDKGRIVVGMVVSPYARRPIVFSSGCESGTIELVDLPSILSGERDVKRRGLLICGVEPKRRLLSTS